VSAAILGKALIDSGVRAQPGMPSISYWLIDGVLRGVGGIVGGGFVDGSDVEVAEAPPVPELGLREDCRRPARFQGANQAGALANSSVTFR
jgi:hypothetical protein